MPRRWVPVCLEKMKGKGRQRWLKASLRFFLWRDWKWHPEFWAFYPYPKALLKKHFDFILRNKTEETHVVVVRIELVSRTWMENSWEWCLTLVVVMQRPEYWYSDGMYLALMLRQAGKVVQVEGYGYSWGAYSIRWGRAAYATLWQSDLSPFYRPAPHGRVWILFFFSFAFFNPPFDHAMLPPWLMSEVGILLRPCLF